MFVTESMSDLVLEETRETTKAKARRRCNRDDDDLSVNLDRSDVRASPRASRGGNHDDATTGPHPQGRKPPREKLAEVSGVIS